MKFSFIKIIFYTIYHLDRKKSIQLKGKLLGCLKQENLDLEKDLQMKRLLSSSFMNNGICIQQCFNENYTYSAVLEKYAFLYLNLLK